MSSGGEGAPPRVPSAERQPNGKPPLPSRLSLPGSLASSRTTSPRGGQSVQSSLQALSDLKLAQYRAGSRMFKEDTNPRAGLSNGDVVAFQSQDGVFGVLPLDAENEDPTTVHCALSASSEHASSDACTHLEVVKQGKWLAFRSAAAGDRFLQARKRSPHRLVFFNTNIGTWEQWELSGEDEGAVDGAPWVRLVLTLRHRRLQQFELKVELLRVGTYTLLPHASITPRSLPAPAQDADISENTQLRKMSGVLMHEWFNFVDREKQLRMNIAVQVGQLAQDAADLRAWAVCQVDTIRSEMDEEVSQLLTIIQRKSAKLEDTTARLTNRLRWGVALLQAKNELGVKRQVFSWWRGMTSRKRYCRHVVAKLQQRADARLASRALEAWELHYQEQQTRQQRLFVAVRRMAFIKMYHAFASWRDLVAAKREATLHYQWLAQSSWAHMQKWRMQQTFAAWRTYASSCSQGQALLARLASRMQQQAVAAAFAAWHLHISQQQLRLESLTALVAARQRHYCLQQALTSWRDAVDTKHGRRLQLEHAQHLLRRLRARQVLQAWRAWRAQRAKRQQAWLEMLDRLRLRLLQRAFVAWAEEVAYRRERQELLMRFVSERALAMTQQAFLAWQEHTARKREQALFLQRSVDRMCQRLLSASWVAWCQYVEEVKVQHHRIAVCQRRREASTLRAALGAWRGWATGRKALEQAVQQGVRRSNRTRLAAAFWALATNVELAHAKCAQHMAAVEQYARQLQGRALAGWVEAVRARHGFEQRLRAVGESMQVQALRGALQGWHAVAQASIEQRQRGEHAQRLLSKLRLRAVLRAWRGYRAYQQHLQLQLMTLVGRRTEQLISAAFYNWQEHVAAKRATTMRMFECTMRISQLRLGWTFSVWRQEAAQRAMTRQALAGSCRRINRIKLAAAFAAWREHIAAMAGARAAAEQLATTRASSLVQQCLAAWAEHAAAQADQRAAVMRFVQRRSTWVMANMLHIWRSFVEHSRAKRQEVRRARRRLARLRLQQAFRLWRQEAGARREQALAQQAAQRKLQAKRQARFFQAWSQYAAGLRRARQAAKLLAGRAQQGQLAAGFHGWREVVGARRRVHLLLRKFARKTDRQLTAAAFQAWRQQVQRQQQLRRVESSLGSKRQQARLAAAFKAWRQHTLAIHATRAAVNDRHHAEAAVLLRVSLRSWQAQTAQRREFLNRMLLVCVDRQATSMQALAFSAWRHYMQARRRAQEVMMRAVDRLCMRITRAAFEGWRDAARAHKARATAIARFTQRWEQHHMRGAFSQWQRALAERKAAEDNLRRCLTRKRVAFKLFRNWYWESFDDDVQETLRTMFELTNEAAADPLPSRACSPVSSLLSSPIRAQLGQTSFQQRREQQQLAAGVAQRLAQPGSTQPSVLRMQQGQGQLPEEEAALQEGGGGVSASLYLQLGPMPQRQPLPPQPAPLRKRVGSAPSSPTRHSYGPAAGPNLGGAILAPFRQYAASSLGFHYDSPTIPALHASSQQPSTQGVLSPHSDAAVGYARALPRVYSDGTGSASPVGTLQDGQKGFGSGGGASSSIASGTTSKVASTIEPRSPLTPSSAGYMGGSTSLTHYATPNPDGMFTVNRVPGTLSASRPARRQQGVAAYEAGGGAEQSPRVLPGSGTKLLASPPQPGSHPQAGAAVSPARWQAQDEPTSSSFQQQPYSPSGLSEAATPGAGLWGVGSPAVEGQASTPLSAARTPFPGAAGASPAPGRVEGPTPDPNLAGYAISPGLEQQLAEAATPMAAAGVQPSEYYECRTQMKRMSEEGSLLACSTGQFHTPQASFRVTPAGAMPELQGDYSMKRMSAATEHEATELAAQGTPNPDDFIAAYPGSAHRSWLFSSSQEELATAKTPLGYVNPMIFDSPTK